MLGFLFAISIAIVSSKPSQLFSEEVFGEWGQVRPDLYQQAEEDRMLRVPR